MPRLDVLITQSGLAESRERAQALIMAGKVRVAGETERRPGRTVPQDAPITIEFKPQFQVERVSVGKGGIVRDQDAIDAALRQFREWCSAHGFSHVADAPSEVAGAGGNREIFVHMTPSPS